MEEEAVRANFESERAFEDKHIDDFGQTGPLHDCVPTRRTARLVQAGRACRNHISPLFAVWIDHTIIVDLGQGIDEILWQVATVDETPGNHHHLIFPGRVDREPETAL